MKFGMNIVGAAAFALGLSTLGAAAATCSALSGGKTVGYELIQSETPLLSDHVVAFECEDDANDTNTILPGYEIFGMTGWILSDKSDGFASPGPLTWAEGSDGFTGPQPGGTTWSVAGSLSGISDVFVTLKQKNSFAAFKLDLAELLEGTWSTSDIFGSGSDISHGSIYYKECAPGVPCDPPGGFEVPLPAGMPLILVGLGAFGALRLRSRKKA